MAAWGFGMGANWALVSVPFFGFRECIMHYRHFANNRKGTNNLLARDKDELIASASSGALVGAGLGHIWRGPRGILPGILLYSTLASGAQLSFSTLRHWRLTQAEQLELAAHSPTPTTPTDTPLTLLQRWKTQLRYTTDADPQPAHAKEWDPIGWLAKWTTARIAVALGQDPAALGVDSMGKGWSAEDRLGAAWWASPVLNAIDMEYRIRLNKKIEALERQVARLEEEVRDAEEAKTKTKTGSCCSKK
ncbi:hypothetical protein HDU96_008391 [Phlyctochytrium bullatum]|nr:hypothetical protein HDU96_008391 [Phlyctochytrium bullatum]